MRLTVYTNDLRTTFGDVLREYDIEDVDSIVDRLIDALEEDDRIYPYQDRHEDD